VPGMTGWRGFVEQVQRVLDQGTQHLAHLTRLADVGMQQRNVGWQSQRPP
jgi:hypothetical protein